MEEWREEEGCWASGPGGVCVVGAAGWVETWFTADGQLNGGLMEILLLLGGLREAKLFLGCLKRQSRLRET